MTVSNFSSFLIFFLPWHGCRVIILITPFTSYADPLLTFVLVRPLFLIFHLFLPLTFFSHFVRAQPLVAVKKEVIEVKIFKIMPDWNILFYPYINYVEVCIRNTFPFVFYRLHCLHLCSLSITSGNLILCIEVRMTKIATYHTKLLWGFNKVLLVKHLEQWLAYIELLINLNFFNSLRQNSLEWYIWEIFSFSSFCLEVLLFLSRISRFLIFCRLCF